jgi:hypothetical protein
VNTFNQLTFGVDSLSILKYTEPITRHLRDTNGDFLLYLDAHSDYDSGELIYRVDMDGNDVSDSVDSVSQLNPFAFLYTNIPKLIDLYMGDPLRHSVNRTTGLRGLVLLTCGPSWTVREHYEKVFNLVKEYVSIIIVTHHLFIFWIVARLTLSSVSVASQWCLERWCRTFSPSSLKYTSTTTTSSSRSRRSSATIPDWVH